MLTGITQALKSSITGRFEITRISGALGILSYIIGVHVFLYWKCIHLGQDFPLETYCLAYPTGLAALGGGTAAAAALKDRQSAISQSIADTGTVPSKTPPAQPAPTASVPADDEPANL